MNARHDRRRISPLPVSPSEPLTVVIEITGKNPEALPRHFVGIDRIELAPGK